MSELRIENRSERDLHSCEEKKNPVEASECFLGFLCNCLSSFTTAKISFTSIKRQWCTVMYEVHKIKVDCFSTSNSIIINNSWDCIKIRCISYFKFNSNQPSLESHKRVVLEIVYFQRAVCQVQTVAWNLT